MNRVKLFIHKLTHWEYWPFLPVYFPMFFVWLYYSVKARAVFFFLPSNPGIKNAGLLLESKKEIYDNSPTALVPKTILSAPQASIEELINKMQDAAINFPCIAKPDIGMKGLAVCLIDNVNALANYSKKANFDFLIQEYISWPNEVGIFYYRYPNSSKGHISGITKKEFLTVSGNGKNTIEELLQQDPRHRFQLFALKKLYGKKLCHVLQNGEIKTLVPYGNHARGAKFTDITHEVDATLESFMDEICLQIQGFYFGRLDIRYNSLEDLKEKQNFCIIEINGAGSDPTHIYDPRHNIFFAWKEIARHYKLLYEISAQNHKLGHPHISVAKGLQMIRENSAMVKKLEAF